MRNLCWSLVVAISVISAGCARTITVENPNSPNREQIASFTPEDIEATVGEWMKDIVAFGPVAESTSPPLVGYCGIKNMGSEIIEMTEFERAFKYWGIRSRAIRFTSVTTLPDNFFDQHNFQKSAAADKNTAVEIGKIQGWRYSLYGDLFSQAPKNAKGARILYYNVYIYMIDIQTGEEVWNSRKQFKLRDSKPAVGW